MMAEPIHILLLEPYYGGSHAAFVNTFCAHTKHRTTLVTLPARKWKWRMRGAAIWFTHQDRTWMNTEKNGKVDLIFCSDMLSVADLRALLPSHCRDTPIVCYFHENQLTYPIPIDQTRDYQYGMTNITSCLAADAVWFNSQFHLDDFLDAADVLLRKMPDFVPQRTTDRIRHKAQVSPPPVSLDIQQESGGGATTNKTILWCHRWEFDKNPEPFFEALLKLDAEGHEFDLVMLGEQFRTAPPIFADSWDRLKRHITHAGFIPDRKDFIAMLTRCNLVVSSAIQENFGIGVIEAILAGCQPLLPARLAYPEVIPAEFHEQCLFARDDDLHSRLRDWLEGRNRLSPNAQQQLTERIASKFAPSILVSQMDTAFERLVEGR